MGRLPKKDICVWLVILIFITNSAFALEIENTADNPRLVNITVQQKKMLKMMEERLYNNSFEFENNIDRIERLELDLLHGIQSGSATQRINTLKLESTRAKLRGTAMTPMMQDAFNSRYINPRINAIDSEDVGIIDGLIRVWWPDLYAQLCEFRRFKDANYY